MRRWVVFFCALLLLCHCATKHQPIPFAPYFPLQPEGQFNPKSFQEIQRLEGRADLNGLEKKRLWELYSLEFRGLKPGSNRFAILSEKIDRLHPEVADLEKETLELQAEVMRSREVPPEKPMDIFENPILKKEYTDAYQLWNKDQNDLAQKKIESILKNVEFVDRATKKESFKITNLRFRVALDLGNYALATPAYEDLRKLEPCATETAQAGFLMALLAFTSGNRTGAQALFEGQCDPDESLGNKARRKYWLARFNETGESNSQTLPLYLELASAKLPGYYQLMSQMRLGQKFHIPIPGVTPAPYLSEFKTSSRAHLYLSSAEERLKASLRRDAALYLMKVTDSLKKDAAENVVVLLYTAHLFQAAGEHLEAMKIYSILNNVVLEEEASKNPKTTFSFTAEMYPRSFADRIDWLCRIWKVDPDFVFAIIRQESAFNPGAISASDARGMMQLMPQLAKSLSKQLHYGNFFLDRKLLTVEENLKLAVFHIYQLKANAPHLALMAAAYNAGINRVRPWWKRFGNLPLDVFIEMIPINETRNYVKLVLRNFIYYKALHSGGEVDPSLISFSLPLSPGGESASRTS